MKIPLNLPEAMLWRKYMGDRVVLAEANAIEQGADLMMLEGTGVAPDLALLVTAGHLLASHKPDLLPRQHAVAEVEGLILGMG